MYPAILHALPEKVILQIAALMPTAIKIAPEQPNVPVEENARNIRCRLTVSEMLQHTRVVARGKPNNNVFRRKANNTKLVFSAFVCAPGKPECEKCPFRKKDSMKV